MTETPHPYGPEAQGQAQIAHEQQLLAESYAYPTHREVSQATLRQHQARIAELLDRQTVRAETGQPYLPQPVRTRVVEPTPAPAPPAPEPRERRPRLVVQGEVTPWIVRGPVDPETPGEQQMLEEAEQLFQVRQRALGPGYKTPEEAWG
jgi:hypothetical protein